MVFDSLTLDVDTAVGVAVHPDHGSDAGDPAAAGRPGRHGGQVSCRAACSCSTRRWSPGRCAGSGSPATCAARWTPASWRSTSSPRSRCADRRLVGVECLARWEHPAHGTVAPGGLRRGGRAHRPARPAHRGGAPRGPAAQPGLARRRPAARRRGQPLRPYADRPALPGPGRRSCSTEYGVPPQLLTLEITEDGMLGRAPTGRMPDPAAAARPRRPAVGGRLRHRLLVAVLPAPAAGARGQDRPVVRAGHGDRPGRPGDRRAVVDLAQHFGLAVVAEGVESELTLDLLEDMGCDDRPGLPVQPAAAVRAVGGLVRRPGRAGDDRPPGELPRLRVVP